MALSYSVEFKQFNIQNLTYRVIKILHRDKKVTLSSFTILNRELTDHK